ncbi:MAG: hypothetical protein ABEI31_02575 [Halodesulfurarchaeum sp.]
MAVPPPQGDQDEPDAVAFGIAAVDAALPEDLEFPADAGDIQQAVGDPEIPYDSSGRSIPLSVAIRETDRNTFESRRDLLNALHPVFEEKREAGGVGAWLRSLVPF